MSAHQNISQSVQKSLHIFGLAFKGGPLCFPGVCPATIPVTQISHKRLHGFGLNSAVSPVRIFLS